MTKDERILKFRTELNQKYSELCFSIKKDKKFIRQNLRNVLTVISWDMDLLEELIITTYKKKGINENKEFLKWYNQKIKEGFFIRLSLDDMQNLINKIVSFFEFKYHNKMLTESIYYTPKSDNYYKSKELAKQLDINQLKYRLRHDYVQFLECSYFSTITLKKEKKNLKRLKIDF